MTHPGPIAQRAAQDALLPDVLSVREEGGPNAGKWVEAILADVGLTRGQPWCAAFVHTRLHKAAHELGLELPADFPRSGYTPDYAAWAKHKGLWLPVGSGKQAKAGDLALYYSEAQGRLHHVGIVTEGGLYGGFYVDVEGNTGPDGALGAPNVDGDGVYCKRRRMSVLGIYGGFARLPF